jgi:hypothetical protein
MQLLERYRYQPALTPTLDKIGTSRIDRCLANEIVLWKVNRYVDFDAEVLAALNRALDITPRNRRQKGAPILRRLLEHRGIDLPMASTLLRFRNQAVFQVIDRRAYRAVYGTAYPLKPHSRIEDKIEVYFEYLDKLTAIAQRLALTKKPVDFTLLDRILYVFDKLKNGKL